MRKNTINLGLILICAGSILLLWEFYEKRNEKQILQTLNVRVDKLDKLIAGEIGFDSLGEIVLNESSQKEIDQYYSKKKIREKIKSASFISVTVGSSIILWWSLLWLAKIITSGLHSIYQKIVHKLDMWEKGKNCTDKKEQNRQNIKCEDISEILMNSGWRNIKADQYQNREKKSNQNGINYDKSEPCTFLTKQGDISKLYSDEKNDNEKMSQKEVQDIAENIQKTILSDCQENAQKLENTFKEQTEYLELKISEFKELSESIKGKTLDNTTPQNDAITELFQQVSAIREYTSHQQTRMQKLQDGYDWSIIRTFCLRIIRCIDNLENRIESLEETDNETSYLEEVRDELIFALESSGIEQFEPEVESNYRGQEKDVEAIKEKESAETDDMKGKIAKIIKPGYVYILDENNMKVVRTARVKLYE